MSALEDTKQYCILEINQLIEDFLSRMKELGEDENDPRITDTTDVLKMVRDSVKTCNSIEAVEICLKLCLNQLNLMSGMSMGSVGKA